MIIEERKLPSRKPDGYSLRRYMCYKNLCMMNMSFPTLKDGAIQKIAAGLCDGITAPIQKHLVVHTGIWGYEQVTRGFKISNLTK